MLSNISSNFYQDKVYAQKPDFKISLNANDFECKDLFEQILNLCEELNNIKSNKRISIQVAKQKVDQLSNLMTRYPNAPNYRLLELQHQKAIQEQNKIEPAYDQQYRQKYRQFKQAVKEFDNNNCSDPPDGDNSPVITMLLIKDARNQLERDGGNPYAFNIKQFRDKLNQQFSTSPMQQWLKKNMPLVFKLIQSPAFKAGIRNLRYVKP